METNYNVTLVVISYIVASLGSLMALISTRNALMRSNGNRGTLVFLASLCLGGVGIWSMHFIGMLALTVHGTEINYNWPLTALSFVVGVVVVYIGLLIMTQGIFNYFKLVAAGIIVGLGVAAMHYTGMLAMHVQADIQWDWNIIYISIAIAVTAAIVALWLLVHVKMMWQMVACALVMGVAVCGMHYTGMAAACYMSNTALPSVAPMSLGATIFTLTIVAVDFIVVLIATVTATVEGNKRAMGLV
jgi:NO-binding membrane sensor protein with MHYT domain